MRLEVARALKYLLPRKRSLSTSIISLLSVTVITLVVWLVLLFLSITEGIEKRWLEELTATSAPLQVRPKEAYYHSYYYLIDSYAANSHYQTKSLKEKLKTEESDPFDPLQDAELPPAFPIAEQGSDGKVRDLVKELDSAMGTLSSHFRKTRILPFEMAFCNLQLNLCHQEALSDETDRSFLTQVAYVTAFDGQNEKLKKMLLSPKKEEHISTPTVTSDATSLPNHPTFGHGILVAKGFQKSGVHFGDSGSISFYAPGGLKVEEMHFPIFVAGFYDPGMVPLGNRLILADESIVSALKNDYIANDTLLGDGFQIFFDDINDAPKAKVRLEKELSKRGLDRYFQVESFTDYEFSKPIFQQLKSDKNLFSLIALLILLVACSNIISMLILLVNDKRKEIAILQALGMTRTRIALLFGTTGLLTGLVSLVLGCAAALFTLRHIDSVVKFLSFLQGHEAFQEIFYGAHLPNELSMTYLLFVFTATILLSILAGLIPALKAARIHPTEIFKQE